MLARQGAIFHFRRAVPARLRPIFGKGEVWASLGTTSVTMARARAGRLYAAVEELFAVADKIRRSDRDKLQEELLRLKDETIAEQTMALALLEENAKIQAEVFELRSLMAQMQQAKEFSAFLEESQKKIEALEPLINHMGGRLTEARVQVRRGEDLAVRLVSAAVQAFTMPNTAVASPASQKPLASDLVEPFFKRRAETDKATHQVMGQERGTLRRFIEFAGNRPIDTYGRADMSGFLDKLRRLPKTYGKSPRDKGRGLDEIIAEADARRAERLSDKTVKRHLSTLSQFFQLAVDKGYLTVAARIEIIEGHRFQGAEVAARDQRDTWRPNELTALFASPVWTGCQEHFRAKPGTCVIRDAKFWLPLLALYQGGRLEEFADLYRRDIVCNEGTWAVTIAPSIVEGKTKEGTAALRHRRLKTANAKRTIPLHPEILKMGFLAYVETTAPKSDSPLFPDILPQGEDGKRGPRITRWFVEYRRSIGVYRKGVGIHAFRHTANTRLRDSIVDWQQEREVNYLFGHALGPGQGGERYDKGPGLKKVAATLALLSYPEIDLSHLYMPSG